MGLDMYLERAKRIDNATVKDITAINGYLDWTCRDEKYKDCSMDEWNGTNPDDVKHDLVEKYITDFTHKYSYWDTNHEYGHLDLWEGVGYWRKANQIHNWFVENVQNGVDDCGCYEVTKEQLEELLKTCRIVKASSEMTDGQIWTGTTYHPDGTTEVHMDPGKVVVDTTIAEKLLPTTSGFFFGGTDYDEWYMRDIDDTINILSDVLATTDFDHQVVAYQSSW